MAKQHNFVVFDCETGGLDKETNFHASFFPITEIGLLSLDGSSLSEITRYSSYIKGKVEPNFIPESSEIVPKYVGYGLNKVYQKTAFKMTGVSIDLLEKNGQDHKKVCSDIIEFFEKSASGSKYHKIILVGHNVTYDIPFLQELFLLNKKDLSKYLQGYYDNSKNFNPVYFDTQFLSRVKSTDESFKHNLADVTEREGIELYDAHTAMKDVIATSEVFKKYIVMLRNPSLGVSSDEPQANSNKQRVKFDMY